jgi:hypothetical protein
MAARPDGGDVHGVALVEERLQFLRRHPDEITARRHGR